jgi:hypothetical protein
MNKVECSECNEVVEVTGSSVVFPYVCSACLGDDTDYADEETQPYNSGVPCQSALGSGEYDIEDTQTRTEVDQFDADTEVINDLKTQLETYQMLSASVDLYAMGLEQKVALLESDRDFYKRRLAEERSRTWFDKLIERGGLLK